MKSLQEYINESELKTSLSTNKVQPKTKDELKFYEITDKTELKDIIKKSVPQKPKNPHNDRGHGFWLFDEAIRKDENYADIGAGLWNIHYIKCEFKSETCGLISYSLTYWNDQKNKPIKGNIMHIFDIQTLSTYKGLLKFYFNKLEEIAKSNKCKAISLRFYDKGLINIYSKYGFESDDNEERLMIKRIY